MSTLTVSLIQTSIVWENAQANLELLTHKINSISGRTEVIILPEAFNTGFSMNPSLIAETMDGPSIQWMKKMAFDKNAIITGSLFIHEEGNYYNRLIWMLPNGQFGYYDKRHLFSYAGEDQHYQPGKKRIIAQVKGFKVNLQICYDLRFPVWSRLQADNEFDVLLYVANWPDIRIDAWKCLLKARAIENQCYTIGVNRVGEDGNQITYSGYSSIYAPNGEEQYQKQNTEDIFTYTLKKEIIGETRKKFPFQKDKDVFNLI